MKKTLVTLLAATTLAAAVAPVVGANDNHNPINHKANYDNGELGRAYSIAKAKADLAEGELTVANQDVKNAEDGLAQAESHLTFVQSQKTIIVAQYETELGSAVEKDKAGSVSESPAAREVVARYAGLLEKADADLKMGEDTVKNAKVLLADAKNVAANKKAAFDKAYAELEAAYQAFLKAGGNPATVAPAAPAADATKPAAAGVKAAATPTGQKALPKTSAAK